MTRDTSHFHDGEGVLPGYLLNGSGGTTRPAGGEDLVFDPVFDRRSVEQSLSILACREYEENGPSQA